MIGKVRGEGMVFGIECNAVGDLPAQDVANELVKACYLGRPGGDGIHLLGPLAGTVLRVSPPLSISQQQSRESLELLFEICQQVAEKLTGVTAN